MNTDISWGQQGWICPKCGCVYAPHVDECRRCNGGYNNAAGVNIETAGPSWLYDPTKDSVKWGYDIAISSTGVKPAHEDEGTIITNTQQMLDRFDKATEINEDTFS